MRSCWLCCAHAHEGPRLNEIPLFPLNIVLFPNGPLPLRIFETRYVDMVRRCLREDSGFGVVLIREGREAEGPAETCDVGTFAKIVDFDQLPDGLLGLSCVGQRRFRIRSRRRQPDGLNVGDVEWLEPEPFVSLPARHARLGELLASVLPQLGDVYAGTAMQLDDTAWVGHRLAEILPIALTDKQFCLELDDPVRRLDVLAPMIQIVAADEEDDEEGAGEEGDDDAGTPKIDH
jgi:Lon protease-like protein